MDVPVTFGRLLITAGLFLSLSCGVVQSSPLMPSLEFYEGTAAEGPGYRPVPTSLVVRTSNLVLKQGETFPLSSVITLPDGSPPSSGVIWTISDPRVATVNAGTGALMARSPGFAKVTATRAGASVELLVNVSNLAAARRVWVDPPARVVAVGEQLKLIAMVQLMTDEINGDVTWISSDATRARVNRTTGVVTALAEGKVTIRASHRLNPQKYGLSVLTIQPRSAAPAAGQPAASANRRPSPSPSPSYMPGQIVPGRMW